jgi:hypothetical protein
MGRRSRLGDRATAKLWLSMLVDAMEEANRGTPQDAHRSGDSGGRERTACASGIPPPKACEIAFDLFARNLQPRPPAALGPRSFASSWVM